MTSLPGITLFVPVFNEGSLLVSNTRSLREFIDPLGFPYEIIIGSNGSTDSTVELGRQLCSEHSNIRFFHLPQKGVGAAFREGVRIAGYNRIITVDIDLSISLGFISEACGLLSRYDIVIGSKITGSQRRSWIRRMASISFIRLAKILLNIRFHDYSIGAKGYRKEVVEEYLHFVDDKTFYVVEIVCRACQDGKRVKEIPVRCLDMRTSRFNLMHEGVYKFGNLFRLWLSLLRSSSGRRISEP
jgi:glycosyltransferase involved in cell wall biosynthesis